MSLFQVVVTEATDQGEGNRALRLEPVFEPLPPFAAGAHVDVHLPGGLVRQYSIASDPGAHDHYLLCVKREPDSRGGSRHLHEQLGPGHRLWISAPRNLFALQAQGPHLLLAAGIGITPLLSMAQALEARGEPFVLHYYVHAPAQAAFAERLRAGFAHGRVELHASSAGESPRRHVPEELMQAAGHLYLCGPNAFMDRFSALATAHGWRGDQVHREHFAGTASGPQPGDTAFEVELASTGEVVEVAADTTIAQALAAAGVPLPVSCEQGICGACLTRVVAGTPDHRDAVMSAAEHAANTRITPCCSRSRSPRLVLDL